MPLGSRNRRAATVAAKSKTNRSILVWAVRLRGSSCRRICSLNLPAKSCVIVLFRSTNRVIIASVVLSQYTHVTPGRQTTYYDNSRTLQLQRSAKNCRELAEQWQTIAYVSLKDGKGKLLSCFENWRKSVQGLGDGITAYFRLWDGRTLATGEDWPSANVIILQCLKAVLFTNHYTVYR